MNQAVNHGHWLNADDYLMLRERNDYKVDNKDDDGGFCADRVHKRTAPMYWLHHGFSILRSDPGRLRTPYTDFTGQPIRWQELDTTTVGMVHRGYVVDVLINCRSGMMTFDVFGMEIPWRSFSERALVVHKPRDACEDRGFSPRF